MKSYIVVALALAVVSVACAEDKFSEKFEAAFNKCRESHPVTDAEVDQVKRKEDIPNSPEAKCLMACMLKEGKILKDGKYSKENALVMADVIHKDDADQAAKGKEVIEICTAEVGTEVGSDECEFAYKMAVCGHEHAKKLGVKTPEF